MTALTLSTKNIISLTKLEVSLRREYGLKFNLSQEESLFNLLKIAAESSNPVIEQAYHQFYQGLPEEEKHKLTYHGITLKPHQQQDETSGTLKSKDQLPEGVVKMVYRGNVVYKKNGQIIQNPFEESGNNQAKHAKRKPKTAEAFSSTNRVDNAKNKT